jgi:hypothetical protein
LTITLEKEINSLRHLKIRQLKARYRELFGEESPSHNRDYVFRRIAWRQQALSERDLSEKARQRAAELASDADLRIRAPRQFWQQLEAPKQRHAAGQDLRLPLAGTELSREYRGRTIRVKVLEDSFEYEGEKFASLSAIASLVTGTRWNGFAFFRVKRQAANE